MSNIFENMEESKITLGVLGTSDLSPSKKKQGARTKPLEDEFQDESPKGTVFVSFPFEFQHGFGLGLVLKHSALKAMFKIQFSLWDISRSWVFLS